MPTNKTALEMLIEKLEKELDVPMLSGTDYAYNDAISVSISKCKDLLPTERTQIKEAFEEGYAEANSTLLKEYKSASDYYTKTFKDGE